jgi:hypothetical protein
VLQTGALTVCRSVRLEQTIPLRIVGFYGTVRHFFILFFECNSKRYGFFNRTERQTVSVPLLGRERPPVVRKRTFLNKRMNPINVPCRGTFCALCLLPRENNEYHRKKGYIQEVLVGPRHTSR